MKYIVIPVAIIFSMSLVSCEKIFEENIEKKTIVILAPADSAIVEGQTVTFWWEAIEGAAGYELQVVAPAFQSASNLWLDTIVEENKFTFLFSPGNYEWRIRGINSAYQTAFSYAVFTVDSSADLSGQTLLLISPNDNLITNQTRILFKWSMLSVADDYRFELAQPDFSGSIVLDINLTSDTFSYTLDEGQYQWRVRAQNNTSNTQYATRTITIDTTAPLPPTLTAPANDEFIVNDSVQLSWSRNSVDVVFDSVFIYQDSLAINVFKTDRTTVSSYLFTTGALSSSYYWRVKSIDAAGNAGSFSSLRKFILQ